MGDEDVLRNLAAHLRVLAADVAHVAGAVGDVTAQLAPPPASPTIRSLQKIDALEQSLFDLARLAEALACPAAQRDLAFGALQLDATRALLASGAAALEVRVDAIDLF